MGSLILITFIDLDRFREPIASRLSQAIGMTVRMESLNLEFAHGLGFRCGGLHIESKDGSGNLFFAEKMYLLADLGPLLKKQLKLKKVVIVQPVVKLNLESFTPKDSPPPTPLEPARVQTPEPPSPPKKVAAQIQVPDQSSNQKKEPAEVQVADQSPGQKDEIENFRKNLKRPDFNLESVEIHDGQIILIKKNQPSGSSQNVPINFSLQLEVKHPTPERMDVVIDLLQLRIDDFIFRGSVQAEDLLSTTAQVKTDLKSDPIALGQLSRIENFIPDFQFPKELEKGTIEYISLHLDTPLEGVNDLDALKDRAHVDFSLQIRDAVYHSKAGKILIPELMGEGTWEKYLLRQKIHGEVFGGKFEEEGIVRFPKPTESENAFSIDSDINITGLDFTLANFPDQEDWMPSKGKVNGSFKVKGQVPVSEKGLGFDGLFWNGAVNGENLVFHDGDSPQQIIKAIIQIKDGTSKLTTAEVELLGINTQDISLKKARGIFKIKPDRIELVEGKIWPQNGVLQLKGNYHVNQNIYSLNIQGKNLRAEDLSQSAVIGPVSFSGEFDGRMTPRKGSKKLKYDHFTDGLSGTFNINASNGTIQKLGDLAPLLSLLSLTTSIKGNKNGLGYEFIGGDFKIQNGLLETNNFSANGPKIKMSVFGKAKLPNGKVDAEIKAMPLQMLDSLTKSIPLLGKILTGGKKGGLLVTYCKVTGTLENPEFKLQPHKSATKKTTDMLKEITNLPMRLMDSQKKENSKTEGKN